MMNWMRNDFVHPKPFISRMKRILLIDTAPQFIAELQSKLARKCDLLATGDFDTAWGLLRKSFVDLILIHLPPAGDTSGHKQLKKMLKKLGKKKYAHIPKVLIGNRGGEDDVSQYLRMGVAAVVTRLEEMEKFLNF